jgi:uncharacterized membrane protein YphA (DoxX/SURF4 family)
MQRTFSNFPSARAGVALLLLRVVVGTSSILEAGLMIARNNAQAQAATIAAALVIVAGLAVIIGFMTPIAILLICLMGAQMMLVRIPPAALLLLDSRMAAFEFAVELSTLILLGPGAISVDARLFGRREVAIREAPRLNDS